MFAFAFWKSFGAGLVRALCPVGPATPRESCSQGKGHRGGSVVSAGVASVYLCVTGLLCGLAVLDVGTALLAHANPKYGVLITIAHVRTPRLAIPRCRPHCSLGKGGEEGEILERVYYIPVAFLLLDISARTCEIKSESLFL